MEFANGMISADGRRPQSSCSRSAGRRDLCPPGLSAEI